MNRRSFLKGFLAVAAATAAGPVVSLVPEATAFTYTTDTTILGRAFFRSDFRLDLMAWQHYWSMKDHTGKEWYAASLSDSPEPTEPEKEVIAMAFKRAGL